MIELNRIYNEDCLIGMKRIPDGFVDLTVTSPPYDNLRTYNGNIEQWSFEKFQAIAKELYRVTKHGGVVVWIVADATIKGSETGTSFKQALYFKEVGFNLHDTMIYRKDSCPFPDKVRYYASFEYMFVLSKGKPKSVNLITDKPNKWAGQKAHGTERQANGKMAECVATKNNTGRVIREFGVRQNVWDYAVGKWKVTKDEIAYQHPAIFPEQLAQDHIISWSNEGDLVLDPFMGSGTTAKMALLNNRNFIGFEIDKHYCEIANERIRKALAEKEASE